MTLVLVHQELKLKLNTKRNVASVSYVSYLDKHVLLVCVVIIQYTYGNWINLKEHLIYNTWNLIKWKTGKCFCVGYDQYLSSNINLSKNKGFHIFGTFFWPSYCLNMLQIFKCAWKIVENYNAALCQQIYDKLSNYEISSSE